MASRRQTVGLLRQILDLGDVWQASGRRLEGIWRHRHLEASGETGVWEWHLASLANGIAATLKTWIRIFSKYLENRGML